MRSGGYGQAGTYDWDTAIGEIGVGIRHEINNPLGTILGFVDLLLTQADAFPEAARRKLEAIRRATLRIRDVVRRLEDIEDRTVDYVPGMQMTDLSGDGPPGPERPLCRCDGEGARATARSGGGVPSSRRPAQGGVRPRAGWVASRRRTRVPRSYRGGGCRWPA